MTHVDGWRPNAKLRGAAARTRFSGRGIGDRGECPQRAIRDPNGAPYTASPDLPPIGHRPIQPVRGWPQVQLQRNQPNQRRSRCSRSSFDKCNARLAAGALAESEICGALVTLYQCLHSIGHWFSRVMGQAPSRSSIPRSNRHGPDDGRPVIAHDRRRCHARRSAESGAPLQRPRG
jgi:hypothetical protein